MKSELIKAIATVGRIHLSDSKTLRMLKGLVAATQIETKNVHHPEYMKKDEIIESYELVTGEKFSKSFIKSHKREDFIMIAIDAINVLEAAAKNSNKPEEVNEMLVGKEIGFELPVVIDEDEAVAAYERQGYEDQVEESKGEDFRAEVLSEMDLAKESVVVGKEMGNSGLPKPVGSLSTSDYLPLYNKEETCDIESKELNKRLLMAQVINAATTNIVKAFISKGMLLSIINKDLFGTASLYKNPAMKVNNQGEFTPAEVALATKTLNELAADYLIPHKMGYIVKPYYMAWFHKGANLTYKAKNGEYLINTSRKVIINLVTKRVVPLNKINCEYLNKTLFVRIAR